MHYTYAFAALGMISSSWAAPLANPVELPASSGTQTSINQLRDQINRLTDAISQDKSINTKNGFSATDAQFETIASLVKTPASFQCPASAAKCPASKQDIIMGLRTTQSDLDVLALHLQNKDSKADLINTDFCNAYAVFQSLNTYLLGSGHGNATASLTLSMSTPISMKSAASSPASTTSPTSATASITPPETFPTHNPSLSTPTTFAPPETFPTHNPSDVNTTPTTTFPTPPNAPSPTTNTLPTNTNTPPTNTPSATAPGPAAPSDLDAAYHELLRSINTFNLSLATHPSDPQTPDSYNAIEDLAYKWIAFDEAVLGPDDAKIAAVGCTAPGEAPARYPTPADQSEAFTYVQQIQGNLTATYARFISQGKKSFQDVGRGFCAIGITWPALADWVGDYDLYNRTGDPLDG